VHDGVDPAEERGQLGADGRDGEIDRVVLRLDQVGRQVGAADVEGEDAHVARVGLEELDELGAEIGAGAGHRDDAVVGADRMAARVRPVAVLRPAHPPRRLATDTAVRNHVRTAELSSTRDNSSVSETHDTRTEWKRVRSRSYRTT
jgi:hypothetical protein